MNQAVASSRICDFTRVLKTNHLSESSIDACALGLIPLPASHKAIEHLRCCERCLRKYQETILIIESFRVADQRSVVRLLKRQTLGEKITAT